MTGVVETAAGAAAGSFVKLLVNNLFSKKRAKGSTGTVAGKWHFHWKVNQPEDFEPKKIDDLVVLRVSKKGIISGTGQNPYYGEYVVTGTDTAFCVTLAYRGKSGTADLPGICLIIKSPGESKMEGVWWQYGRKHSILGGTVVMSPYS